MTELVGFLLARIAEDVAAATAEMSRHDVVLLGAFAPARILANCESKRRIVTEYATIVTEGDAVERVALNCYKGGLGFALRALATSYAAHPDFQEEWRV